MNPENHGGKISKQLLKLRSGEFDLESIHSLNLKNLDINDLGCLGECSGLERLNLSYNDITRLYALASLTSLTDLNLSANRITSLEGLQALDKLESLNISGNLIGSCDALYCLTGLENLSVLRLQDIVKDLKNPVCLNTSYKKEILKMFPNLTELDGERLTGKGSELFKMCEEIDKALEERNNVSSMDIDPSGQWLPDGYWDKKKKFEETSLGDAEVQLKALLRQCHRVASDTDRRLQLAKQSGKGDG